MDSPLNIIPTPVSDGNGNLINPAQEDGNLASLLILQTNAFRLAEINLLRTQSIELATILADEKTSQYKYIEVR